MEGSEIKEAKRGRIAFITTPQYRESRPQDIKVFACGNMFSLFRYFDVITTGGTRAFLEEFLKPESYDGLTEKHLESEGKGILELIKSDTGEDSEKAFSIWRSAILSGLKESPFEAGLIGMVHIIRELVEGRLDAVIHLTDWQDKSAKQDSAVLSREANVHDIPIATNVETAEAYVRLWKSDVEEGQPLFRKREKPDEPCQQPLAGIEKEKHQVLAMISHDGKKLDMCKFAVKHAKEIFKYDFILATGTTGGHIKEFVKAADPREDVEGKIRCCKSGPVGGDLQIASAVVNGFCRDIIFFQDPTVGHPHDSDIRLFEQAVLTEGVHARLATNPASAELLIRYNDKFAKKDT